MPLGLKPSKNFKNILNKYYEKQMDGFCKKDIIKSVRD